MVSEVTSALLGGVIDEIPSMNASHRRHVEEALARPAAKMLRIDGSPGRSRDAGTTDSQYDFRSGRNRERDRVADRSTGGLRFRLC